MLTFLLVDIRTFLLTFASLFDTLGATVRLAVNAPFVIVKTSVLRTSSKFSRQIWALLPSHTISDEKHEIQTGKIPSSPGIKLDWPPASPVLASPPVIRRNFARGRRRRGRGIARPASSGNNMKMKIIK